LVQKDVELRDGQLRFLFAEFLGNIEHAEGKVPDSEASLMEVGVFVVV
jgi:hypothetical protein